MISRSGDSRIKFYLCYLSRRLGDWKISRLGEVRKILACFWNRRLGDQVISRSEDSRIKFSLCYLSRRLGDQ